nr:MAG TPA: hypothetical protein [Caudoviricetes sp.]
MIKSFSWLSLLTFSNFKSYTIVFYYNICTNIIKV